MCVGLVLIFLMFLLLSTSTISHYIFLIHIIGISSLDWVHTRVFCTHTHSPTARRRSRQQVNQLTVPAVAITCANTRAQNS